MVGVFRPVLLLPAGIAGQLDAAQLQSIVLHEMTHVQRRDNLTAFIQEWRRHRQAGGVGLFDWRTVTPVRQVVQMMRGKDKRWDGLRL